MRKAMKLAGVELYFDDLTRARRFYRKTLGLRLRSEKRGHHAQFDCGEIFVCLERKGVEDYPSGDKAVLFFEVADLDSALERIGEHRIVRRAPAIKGRTAWAVLHDPEMHNILLIETRRRR